MDISILHDHFINSAGISTDTRNIPQNSIFFALKGDLFNGNEYAAEALEKGALYAVVDEKKYAANANTILVDNVLSTLQQLANYHRKQCNAQIISLTGSNGKTTTKELIKSVLETTYPIIATEGNLNNHIGVPLTLLRITRETEFAIVEMGANHLKEIELLCSIAEPDYGYITNFGKAHLEGFGGVEGVIKGKSELYESLMGRHKLTFYNADDPIQVAKTTSYPATYSFSFTGVTANVNLQNTTTGEYVSIQTGETEINSHLIGLYNLPNLGIAICMGYYFKVPEENIKKGIEKYIPQNNRSQIIERKSNKIIMDAYNANPSSMTAALDNFSKLQAPNKMIILGDMFELGPESATEHQHIIDHAQKLGLETLFTLGNHFYNTTSKHSKFVDYEALKNHILGLGAENYLILIKGSRGMKMERLLELF